MKPVLFKKLSPNTWKQRETLETGDGSTIDPVHFRYVCSKRSKHHTIRCLELRKTTRFERFVEKQSGGQLVPTGINGFGVLNL